MMSTSRASRASKEKIAKQPPQNVKTETTPNKSQPTAEQMRLAQLTHNRHEAESPELMDNIEKVMELTGREKDEVVVALHDCDNDANRAINMLLEGDDQGEWKESGKRKKKNQQQQKNSEGPTTNHQSDRQENSRMDSFDKPERDRDSMPPRRGRQPPRLARKMRENEENERNRAGSNSRDRGRGRGRGMGSGPGRGRGRGRRGERGGDRMERGGGGGSRFDKGQGPSIGMWTNETAENAEKENSTWGEVSEDWGDEWTGSLEDSKVFTASESNKGFGTGMGDNDAKMFTAPPTNDDQMFSSSLSMNNSNAANSALNDSTNTLHSSLTNSMAPQTQNSIGHDSIGPNSIGQNSIGQNSIGQSGLGSLGQSSLGQASLGQSSLGQSSSLGQRLDLGMLLQKPTAEPTPSVVDQQAQFMSQFAKQATESIKLAVGIGSSSQPNVTTSTPEVRVPESLSQSQTSVTAARQPPRQRTKLPPPSKIPASAVEMPGHLGSFKVDGLEFGNWGDYQSPPSMDSGFSFGLGDSAVVAAGFTSNAVSSSNSTPALNNHVNQGGKSLSEETSPTRTASAVLSSPPQASQSTGVTGLDVISQAAAAAAAATSPARQGGSMFHNSSPPTTTTTSKDYSSASISQPSKMSPQNQIPFPSSTDRKSPHYSQRSSQNSSSKQTTPPSISQYHQPNYSSNYQSSSYSSHKSTLPTTTSSYTHPSSGLASVQSALPSSGGSGSMGTAQSQYGGSSHSSHATYQASSFQSQNTFSQQGQSSLYQAPNTQQSTYTHSSQSTPSYSSQSASSYLPRDSQSASSYQQPAVTQTTNSYQSQSNQQQPSSYQTSASQSGYNSQTYGVSSHQNNLPSTSMSANKLSDSLSKMSVKDTALDSHKSSQYDHSSSSSNSVTLTSSTTTTSNSLPNVTSANVSQALGLGVPPVVTHATTTNLGNSTSNNLGSTSNTTKTGLPLTSKAPPNLPPGVPPLLSHPNYPMVGQPGMPFAFPGLAAQQPTIQYSYEDLQSFQTMRLPMPGYYDMPLQPPTTLTGRDQGLATVPYTAGADGKLNRLDAQSPVQAQTSQQQPGQQQQAATQSAHQQTFFNAATLPPGYGVAYFGGVLPTAGYTQYPANMYPVSQVVPPVTNTAHGSTTGTTQFQKPGAYAGSHAYGTATYDDLSNQGQDFTKGYGTASQPQTKGSGASGRHVTATSNATDLPTPYGKTHTQSFDKNFATNTPPPFNLAAMPTGSQAGAMGAPAAAYAGTAYMPVMAHQPHSQVLHHHLTQDSSGVSSRGSGAPSATQPKPVANKQNYGTNWGYN